MSALRAFTAFNKTAPVSPDVQIYQADRTLLKQVTFPCSLVNYDGFVAAGSCWLQVFDLAVAPTAGAIPLMSIEIDNAGPTPSFLPSLGPITIYNGLWFAVSSTGPTYTAVATAFSVWGAIEETEVLPEGPFSSVGDLTTGVDSRTIWINSAGPKRLMQLDIINGLGAVAYLMIFAKTGLQTGWIPILSVPLLATTPVQTFKFGTDGLAVYSQDADYTQRVACVAAVSTTPGGFTSAGTTLNNIRGYYV